MSIKKNKDGRYEVRLCRRIGKDVRYWKKTGLKTMGEAKKMEREFQTEADQLKAKFKLGVVTWSEAMSDFEIYSKSNHTVSTMYTQLTTLKEYTSVWDGQDIRSLNREQIRLHIENVLKGKALATQNNLAKYIRNVLQIQESKGRIPHNPAKGVSFGKTKFRKLSAMSRSEIELLLKTTKREESPWYPVYRVVYELGLRSGEGYALRWSEVDFENSRVAVENSYCSKSKAFKRPKNGTRRVIPMNESLKVFLQKLRAENSEAEFVLPRIPGWKHGDAAAILQSYQKKLGIKLTNFHSLRASFITHLLQNKESIATIQAMVGHADLSTTQDYIRLTGTDLIGATDSLALDEDENIK